MSDQAAVRGRSGEGLFAVLAPIFVVAAAYGLWWASDRILYVGPFDRAQFGWLVVVPTMLAAPVVAGLVWADLGDRQATGAAAVAAAAVGLAARGRLQPAVVNGRDTWVLAPLDQHDRQVRAALADWIPPEAHCLAVTGGAELAMLAPAVAVAWRP